MLLELYNDLADCKLNIMADYSVKWTHITITTADLLSELDKYLLHNMCIMLQKERSYSVSESTVTKKIRLKELLSYTN